MRGFFTGICFFFFFLITPLAVTAYLINTFVTAGYIEGKLAESKIYESVAKAMPEIVGLPESDIAKTSPEAKQDMEDFLAKELTADYLQKKTEGAINSVSDWLNGKTEAPPTINFTELEVKMEAYAKEKGYEVPNEVSNTLSKPVEIIKPDEGNLRLRDWYQIFQKTPLIFGALCAALLVMIFLLAQGWKSKLRKVSLAFFVPGFLGLLSILPVVFLFTAINGAVTDQLKGPGWQGLVGSVETLIKTISTDVLERMLIIYGGAIILAIILFVAAIFVGGKVKNKPEDAPTYQKTEPKPEPVPASQSTST